MNNYTKIIIKNNKRKQNDVIHFATPIKERIQALNINSC